MVKLSNLQILVLQEHLDYQSKHILTRLLLYGTDALKYFYHRNTIPWVWICGQQDVFLLRWLKKDHYSWEIVRLIKFLRSLKFLVHQMNIIGQMLSNFKILNLHFQNSEEFQCKIILKVSMS